MREDNVELHFLPITTNGFYQGRKNVAYQRGTSLQSRLPFHKKGTEQNCIEFDLREYKMFVWSVETLKLWIY